MLPHVQYFRVYFTIDMHVYKSISDCNFSNFICTRYLCDYVIYLCYHGPEDQLRSRVLYSYFLFS